MSETDRVVVLLNDVVREPPRTVTWASDPGVRQRMQLQARRDTAPELALRRELHRRGLRYRLHLPVVPGTRRRLVDVVFVGPKVAVFVDGCFWHGCREHGRTLPKANSWYWPAKIERNVRRDLDTSERLGAAGWAVLRIWEHEDHREAADRVEQAVESRRHATIGRRD
ncbi:MAG TPA: very short patch repair endonuclease [Acidimicrobiales bacterium]|nr:very short patch repair endonuclease [Acidimicrobiales bacterium]